MREKQVNPMPEPVAGDDAEVWRELLPPSGSGVC